MKRFLLVFGTRPEGIKLLPLLWEFQKRKIPCGILHTDQHRELLDGLLRRHGISPTYRLALFGEAATLAEAKLSMLSQMETALYGAAISAVIVQGDTLSALCGAEYGFLHEIPVIHIEAGMRTYRADEPYPEEVFRRMIAPMASLHFCPSKDEAEHLRQEGIAPSSIFTVGNTFADYWRVLPTPAVTEKKQILVTLHRRENLPALPHIFKTLRALAEELRTYEFLFPIHPNPEILSQATKMLGGCANFHLTPPLPPEEFYRELLASALVLTDSGGVQEECLFLGKKVLVLRRVSERRTDFGFSALVDPEAPNLKEQVLALLEAKTAAPCDYYGNGGAAEKIAAVLEHEFASRQ